MLVFRDGRQTASAPGLADGLARDLRALAGPSSRDLLVSALLRAGELECALADADFRSPVPAQLTDSVARALVDGRSLGDTAARAEELLRLPLPRQVQVSVPEGFAYYALHPLDYAQAAATLPARDSAVVIGIRSIGTTLSALVTAALRAQRRRVERWTVRPGGHPWDRQCEFTPEQKARIRRAPATSDFLVVDEGPGLSGSSLLSVAEALELAGIDAARITLLCAHQPDPQRLCARAARQRWARYRALAAGSTRHHPAEADSWVGAGEWRHTLLDAPDKDWPGSWTTMERSKYFACDRLGLLKFEGHGRFGQQVLERAEVLDKAGFAPRVTAGGDGFARYEVVPGRALRLADLDRRMLDRLAEYCAWRAAALRTQRAPTVLTEMVRVNAGEEFGGDSPLEAPSPELVVLADGRMQPHEWRLSPDGRIWKTDGAGHGDDHFYPGPTDIAWDLAGAIVEWEMDSAATDYFLDRYAAAAGDQPRLRLPAYLNAYALFRLAYCRMAADALAGTPEERRLRRDYRKYRAAAQACSAGMAAV